MKAIAPFSIITSHEKEIELHRERLKLAKKRLNTANLQTTAGPVTPSPRLKRGQQVLKESIAKENLNLARRIFDIMEKPSPIVEKMNDTRIMDGHPGTLNFRIRLFEAQRIHNQNMILASRLDSMQPHYKKTDLCAILSTVRQKKNQRNKRAATKHRKTRFAKELEMALNSSPQNDPRQTSAPFPTRPTGDNRNSNNNTRNSTTDGDAAAALSAATSTAHSHNVLLEYTKIQGGRVLEVAVIKEPFRDRYAIFGIDVDDGQRYELRLTSEEVSNILDGDILVTSVENIEVWMALLGKVELRKVEAFIKPTASLRTSSQQISQQTSSQQSVSSLSPACGSPATAILDGGDYSGNDNSNNGTPSGRSSSRVVLQPSKPTGIKPSGSAGSSATRLAAMNTLRPVLEHREPTTGGNHHHHTSNRSGAVTASSDKMKDMDEANAPRKINNNNMEEEEGKIVEKVVHIASAPPVTVTITASSSNAVRKSREQMLQPATPISTNKSTEVLAVSAPEMLNPIATTPELNQDMEVNRVVALIEQSAEVNGTDKNDNTIPPKPIISKSSSFKSPRAKAYKPAEDSTLANLVMAPEIPASKSVSFLPNDSSKPKGVGVEEDAKEDEILPPTWIMDDIQDIVRKTTASAITSTLKSLSP